jgi:Nucleotidyl transferase AbiEii toxin, Type IV TA system
MNLHKSLNEFKDLIEATAQHLNLRPVFVEKDYWVTYVLKNLANSEHCDKVVFKGGTSLSKAYGYIERFSEDIDLAILSPGEYSDGKMKTLLKQVSEDITKGLSIIEGHPAEVKFGKNRTTAYQYDKVLADTNFGVVKDFIVVEINCFTNPVPNNTKGIQSFIAQFLLEKGENEAIVEYGLQPFTVKVLTAERTYFEKVLSVNRLSYSGLEALIEKVRHFNDIHKLQNNSDLKNKILTPVYFELIMAVRKDDENNRTMAGDWVGNPISSSPLFADLDNIWKDVAPAYEKDMADLSWSKSIPSSADILESLKLLRKFIKQFDDHS